MNPVNCSESLQVHVDLQDLRKILDFMNQAKRLHEGGYYEAFKAAENARELLESLVVGSAQ